MTGVVRRCVVAQVIGLMSYTPAFAQESLFRDPADGAIDLSAWLATPTGFMPLVIPVTEPALEYGGAVALAFIHRPSEWSLEEARQDFEEQRRLAMPSASAVFGMYTGNSSWAAGAGHLGVWREGRWRYLGALFGSSLNLSLAAEVADGSERLFEYGLVGWGLSQSVRYRLGDSDLYLGALYDLVQMEATFAGDLPPGEEIPTFESTLSGLGALIAYDGRNNAFTPDRGVYAKLEWKQFIEALGSSSGYGRGHASLLAWFDPVRSLVLGLKAEASGVGRAAPFWARPSVGLRGIAIGRYAGRRSGVFESELRWDVTRRWSLVGFGGTGWFLEPSVTEESRAWVGSGGVGFRYLVARAFGLRAGLDFAHGNDGFAFYITTGSAWPTF